jgi:steroid delta-isomerase-like uncharacterized protein
MIDAVNHRDVVSVDALLAEDVRLQDIALEVVLQGRSAVRERLDAWLVAVPDAGIETVGLVETDVQASAEVVVTGTQSGAWAEGDASGATVELPVAVVCALHHRAIASLRLYYDLATLLQQVGAL